SPAGSTSVDHAHDGWRRARKGRIRVPGIVVGVVQVALRSRKGNVAAGVEVGIPRVLDPARHFVPVDGQVPESGALNGLIGLGASIVETRLAAFVQRGLWVIKPIDVRNRLPVGVRAVPDAESLLVVPQLEVVHLLPHSAGKQRRDVKVEVEGVLSVPGAVAGVVESEAEAYQVPVRLEAVASEDR